MSARHAVLGLLIQKPDYPYKLATRFADRVGPAWKVNVGQVYQTIERLEREGMIEPLSSNPTRRGERCVYGATDTGVTEFENWLGEPNESTRPQRGALLIKLAMSGPEHAEQLYDAVDRQEQTCLELLREYSQSRRVAPSSGGVPAWKHTMYRLVAEAAVAQLQSEISWLRQVRREISLLDGGMASTERGSDAEAAPRSSAQG